MATTVTQYGITLTWLEDVPLGQFLNGDYYVVAPSGITITEKLPASIISGTRRMHGMMLNPTAGNSVSQGFDSLCARFSDSLNAARPASADMSPANPCVVPTNTSVVAVTSLTSPDSGDNPKLQDGIVFTVLASAPAANSFSPPYCGTDKTIPGTLADLDLSAFGSLAPVSSTPSAATLETYMPRRRFEVQTNWDGRKMHPVNNQPDYGKDMAAQTGPMGLFLHLSYTFEEKQGVLIQLVQYGIDVYGAAVSGGVWGADGGHNMGRKMPLIVAGNALNSSAMLAYADKTLHNIFQEDRSAFTVDAAQMLITPSTSGGGTFPRAPYGGGSLTAPYTSPWTAPVTISQASPAVVTWPGTHYLEAWVPVYFSTTGTLPSPLVPGTIYWVSSTGLTTTEFQFAALGKYDGQNPAPASINTTTSGSGIHTCHYAMLGVADWGEKQATFPDRSGANWDAQYRGINIQQWLAQCLTVRLLDDGIAQWNNQVYFDYVDRAKAVTASTLFPSFPRQMWDAYRNPPTDPSLVSVTISAGGTSITFTFNVSVSIGAGGSTGMTLSPSGGAATLTYASGTGSTALVYNISRTIISGEAVLNSYVQPGNGIESTSGLVDLLSYSDLLVQNNSTQQQTAAMSNGSRQRLFPSTGSGF